MPSIAAVEAFYDAVLPALGLPVKTDAHVAPDGDWHEVGPGRPRNAVEYHSTAEKGARYWFVGFIEDESAARSATRIAFALDDESALPEVEALLRAAGARVLEPSEEVWYPAIFFEDPIGTRLEICARRPRR